MLLKCNLQLLHLSYTTILYRYIFTHRTKQKTIIYMFHTHITWQDIRRGKGHVCVRRWSLATEDVFLFKIHMFTSQEIIRAGGHMCGWLWGSEAPRAPTKCILAQPGAATGLLSYLILYEIVTNMLGALCLPWLEQAWKGNLCFEPSAQSKIS